ncbi:MAG: type IV secretion protein IcmO, partial [Alphaproteobacteria bacterium]|nr:type IV secretion protein IcmO [Alphaproteobacteria bacterium]
MPIILQKHQTRQRDMFRDVRPASERVGNYISMPHIYGAVAVLSAAALFYADASLRGFADLLAVPFYMYFRWVFGKSFSLPFKIPRYAKIRDPHNSPKPGIGDGILYVGNVDDKDDDQNGRELWLTNNDARTHIFYIGTTGAGKTEGLKSIVANSLCWGSGFSYTDGKADTDLWASLYSLTRRFGRDDDIFVLN